jgi:hypothetical protein
VFTLLSDHYAGVHVSEYHSTGCWNQLESTQENTVHVMHADHKECNPHEFISLPTAEAPAALVAACMAHSRLSGIRLGPPIMHNFAHDVRIFGFGALMSFLTVRLMHLLLFHALVDVTYFAHTHVNLCMTCQHACVLLTSCTATRCSILQRVLLELPYLHGTHASGACCAPIVKFTL